MAQGRKKTSQTCMKCGQTRLTAHGRTYRMCADHMRAYWNQQAQKQREKKSGKRKQPSSRPPVRVIALRCNVCGWKWPYTAEYFDVAAQSQTCRRCAASSAITVVNPLTNTARRARIVLLSEPQDIDTGYAAFVLAERERGSQVLVEG